MNYLSVYLKSLLSLKDIILSVIQPYDIYCELTGYELEVGGSKLIESPLRTDSRPTFGLFVPHDEDVILFKDFAYESGDVFKFVKLYALYHDNTFLNSYIDIAYYLNKKLKLDIFHNGKLKTSNLSKKEGRSFNVKTARNIKFKSRGFTVLDKKYWEQYSISLNTLKLYDIKSVDKLLDEENRILRQFGIGELCFAYKVYDKIKLYQPLESGDFKWRNTCPAEYIQGWKQRRGKKKLIITKSMKDIMSFYGILGKKYDIIAPHTEGYNFPKNIVDIINSFYDEVIVIYDYDRAGVNGANKLKNLYNWKPLFIDTSRVMVNGKLKVIDKDISDLISNKGLKKAKERCRKMKL